MLSSLLRGAVALPLPPPPHGISRRRSRPPSSHRRRAPSFLPRAGADSGRHNNNGASSPDNFDGQIVDPDLLASYNPSLDAEVRPEGEEEEDDGMEEYFNDMPIGGTAEGDKLEALTLEELAVLGEEGRAMGLDKVGAFGEEAVMVAGFAMHELPLVQSVLDARQQQGSPLIRLIPISDSNIWRKVGEVLGEKEMPWNLLYGQQGLQCRGWGKERVAVFSGLTLQSQATLLELIDSLGLGRVTPGQLDETDYELPVGEVLAAAVTVYRKALQRKKDGFDLKEDFRRYQKEEEAKSKPVYDLKSDDPDNLGNAINADGSLDPSFMEGVIEKAKAQMTKRLQEEDIDPSQLRNLSLHIGEPVMGESEDEVGEGEGGRGEARVGPELVDLSEEQRRGMVAEAPRPSFGEEEGEEREEEESGNERQAALLAVQEAFEMALRDGMSAEDIEALIDSSCGEGSGAAVAQEYAGGSSAAKLEMEALLQQLAGIQQDEGDGKGEEGEEVSGKGSEVKRAQEDAEEAEEEEGGAEVMTLAQLRETADRHGLDYDKLVRDAEAKGIKLRS